MQVDPIRPTLKAPGTERLKLNHEELPLNFSFKFNLRRYIKVHMFVVWRCMLTLSNPH